MSEKLIELEYGYSMAEQTKIIYNNKMETISAQEYATLCERKRAYAESYFESNDRELDELDQQGKLLQVFANETEDGGQAYYISQPESFTINDTYQFFRELISFGKASRVEYREIDLNELISKYKKYRPEDEHAWIQEQVCSVYNITEDDINNSTLKEYMGYFYKHVKVLLDGQVVTFKFNGDNQLTGVKVDTQIARKKGFTRGR